MHVPNSDYQTTLKIRRYNFFMKNFMHKVLFIRRLNQLLWRFPSVSRGNCEFFGTGINSM